MENELILFETAELKEELDDSVVANFATTASDGKVYQVEHYNLDMIISVGYRVKSNLMSNRNFSTHIFPSPQIYL